MIEQHEELVTIFGGAGFIGRYVTECLLRTGVRVRIASRHPRRDYFIQPLAQVGQFGFVQVNLGNRDSVRNAVHGASAVINLVGAFGSTMQAAHVDGARHIAEAAKKAGAQALVHISAIGADANSVSNYGRTKGEGEAAVRKAFKTATIIRPSLVFGPEDQLTNRFAAMAQASFLPIIAARRNFQPVYVRDLAQAIAKAAVDSGRYGGKTYEIGGPQVLSMKALHEAILSLTGLTPDLVELPDVFGSVMSRFSWLPGAPLTRDQWLMLSQDNVVTKGALGLDAFGIRPTPLIAVGDEWLSRFRRGGKFGGSSRVNQTALS
jgi:NADH dehydrogenase